MNESVSGSRCLGFAPLGDETATVLILGSMPGRESLRQRRYYGHPRNAFWPIMGSIYGAGPEYDYDERVDRLASRGVAVWDVLESCIRPGSLDSAIESESARCNDFAAYFANHTAIRRIVFNGRAAADLYRRHVMPALTVEYPHRHCPAPSTSPAHATLSVADKCERWREALLAP